jgi:amino acid transporter
LIEQSFKAKNHRRQSNERNRKRRWTLYKGKCIIPNVLTVFIIYLFFCYLLFPMDDCEGLFSLFCS